MALDLRSRLSEIIIGSQNWSQQLQSVTTSTSKRQPGEGANRVTGQLVLVDAGTLPSSLDPRSNLLWRPGTRVNVRIRNSGGTLTQSPHGWLYILSTPQVPSNPGPGEVRTLTVEIGCALALKSYTDRDAPVPGLEIGSSTNRGDMITAILQSLSLPALDGAISDYPLALPPVKDGGGFVSMAGELAAGAGHILWQRNDGTIVATDTRPIFLANVPPASFIERILGQHERNFQPFSGGKPPPDTVRVVGEALNVVPNITSYSDRSDKWGPASAVVATAAGTVLLEQTRSRSVFAGGKRIDRVTVFKARGLVVSDEVPGAEGISAFSMVLAEDSEQQSIYEGKPSGKLLETRKTTKGIAGAALGGYLINNPESSLSPYSNIDTAQQIERWRYTPDEVPISRELTDYEPIGGIAPEADYTGGPSPVLLVPARQQEERWRKLGGKEWERRSIESVTRSRTGRDAIGDNPIAAAALTGVTEQRTVSNSGQTQPPAPNRAPSFWEQTSEQIESEAVSGETSERRPETFEQKWLAPGDAGQAQADELAQMQLRLLQGQWLGEVLDTELSDEWFGAGYWPHAVIRVVFVDGTVRYYACDGIAIAVTRDETAVSTDLIWIGDGVPVPAGQAPGGGNELVLPPVIVRQRLGIGLGIGLSMEPLPFPITLSRETMDFGVGVGVNFSVLRFWRFGLGASFNMFVAEPSALWQVGVGAGFDLSVIGIYGFALRTWTGNGSTGQSISTGFTPDWVWAPCYSSTRGYYSFSRQRPENRGVSTAFSSSETTLSNSLAFVPGGFDLGSNVQVNDLDRQFVSWSFAKGAGFDWRIWTGNSSSVGLQAISHKLGGVPDMIVVKALTTSQQWTVYHTGLASPETQYLRWDTNAIAATDVDVWNSTAPTSSQFTVGSSSLTNGEGITYQALLFRAIPGFSAFGVYTGNATNPGPLVSIGFKPDVVVVKSAITTSRNWFVFDSAREVDDLKTLSIEIDVRNSQASQGNLEFNADGFQPMTTSNFLNGSGVDYVYFAFKETV